MSAIEYFSQGKWSGEEGAVVPGAIVTKADVESQRSELPLPEAPAAGYGSVTSALQIGYLTRISRCYAVLPDIYHLISAHMWRYSCVNQAREISRYASYIFLKS